MWGGGVGESDLPACGPLASLSVNLASNAVTPAGSVHKFRGAVEKNDMCYVCECYKGDIVVLDVI